MNTCQFDLKFLLSLTTAICAVLYAITAQSERTVLLAVIFSAVVFACHGAACGHSPAVRGSIAGGCAAVFMILGFFATYIAGYFSQGRPADYFEDGRDVEPGQTHLKWPRDCFVLSCQSEG